MDATYGQLTSLIAEMGGVVVAFSGGVDSSLVGGSGRSGKSCVGGHSLLAHVPHP
jgi:PP-loop superfamily ATP-utilizing enzyme